MSEKPSAGRGSAAPGPPGAMPQVDAEAVRRYIADHPNLLQENPDLLDVLVTPTRGNGKVVDLQHFMVERLKAENERLKNAYTTAIAVARLNQSVQARVLGAVLAILDTRDFKQLTQVVTTDLAVQLQIDVVTIGIEAGDAAVPATYARRLHSLPDGWIDQTMGADHRVLLSSDVTGDPQLFGSAAGLVRSQALARLDLGPGRPAGLLALGSRRPEGYARGQGTELLSFLARALEITIRQWLARPV